MTCPACGAVLDQIAERCPACHAIIAPRLDGALAPAPAPVTPPARSRGERDASGKAADDAAWRREVNERVRQRRKKRGLPAGLPLFPDESSAGDTSLAADESEPLEGPLASSSAGAPTPEQNDPGTALLEDDPLGAMSLRRDEEDDDQPSGDEGEAKIRPPVAREPASPRSIAIDDAEGPEPLTTLEADAFDDEPDVDEEDAAWSLGLDEPSPEVRPLERPATAAERLPAALVDLAILATVSAAVVYFSFKAAQVGPWALVPVWPYLAGFVSFFGLLYAAYFTGISGCTPGKTAFGLRVVDRTGRAPGVWRAGARALVGAVGTLVVLGALPVFFDPARRTLPDRVFRTRVIRL